MTVTYTYSTDPMRQPRVTVMAPIPLTAEQAAAAIKLARRDFMRSGANKLDLQHFNQHGLWSVYVTP